MYDLEIEINRYTVSMAILAAIILYALFAPVTFMTKESISGTVTDTYIKRYDDSDYFFVVIQKDDGQTEIFQNKDNWFWLKANSADVQQRFSKGMRVKVTVVGWRIPLFNWFRNIVVIDQPKS